MAQHNQTKNNIENLHLAPSANSIVTDFLRNIHLHKKQSHIISKLFERWKKVLPVIFQNSSMQERFLVCSILAINSIPAKTISIIIAEHYQHGNHRQLMMIVIR